MTKKPVAVPPVLEWDPVLKEPWHIELEKESVNDERWTCLVTAAVQAEPQDEECILIFNQCATTGIRKAIKTITMTDVINLFKENKKNEEEKTKKKGKGETSGKTGKSGKFENVEKNVLEPPPPRSSEIVSLAANYATFTDFECKLPPDLMAAILKHMILNMKDEHCFKKKVEAARAKKMRERKLKADFIRSLKPFEVKNVNKKNPTNTLGAQEPIDDEPFGGPDLYIMLSDFYNPFYFSELVKINTPFVALLKISNVTEIFSGNEPNKDLAKGSGFSKKSTLLAFWKKLKENCTTLEHTTQFVDIAMIQYKPPLSKSFEFKPFGNNDLFDELSWIHYSLYFTYRHHQNYLQDMLVQRIVISLEPLELSRCKVYNKLCDALITGEPITPYLVLYAMIEQVAAGVPFTESIPVEYEPNHRNFFSTASKSEIRSDDLKGAQGRSYIMVTPCEECRQKKPSRPYGLGKSGEKPSGTVVDDFTLEKGEWSGTNDESEIEARNSQSGETSSKATMSTQSQETVGSNEFHISESLVSRILTEKQIVTDTRQDKKWISPSLCLYGDSVRFQTYHCDSRIINPESIVERFMKNAGIPQLWTKYPELPQEERAFYNFHFYRFWKISKEPQESIRLKIYFTLSMKLIGTIKSCLYRREGEEDSLIQLPGSVREKELSKVRFDQKAYVPHLRGHVKDFSSYFFHTLDFNSSVCKPKKAAFKIDELEQLKESVANIESRTLRGVISKIRSVSLVTHRSSGSCFPFCLRPHNESSYSVSSLQEEFGTLLSLLDCFEISSLAEPHLVSENEDYLHLVREFNFFEKLEPNRMLQRLLETQENYNTIQCSYLALTDTMIIFMHNDYDCRGIFYTCGYGALPTPIALRDFCNFVYPKIREWIFEKDQEYTKFITMEQEKANDLEAKIDEEYLLKLKNHYCKLSEGEKKIYLEEKEVQEEPEIKQEDLEDLPIKPKHEYVGKAYFLTTNITNTRVETRRNVHEYHSRDGTEVDVIIDSWLYEPFSLLTLDVKKMGHKLSYHHWLGETNVSTKVSFKTVSGIIFSFYKSDSTQDGYAELETFNHNVTISWPTGLIIQGMPNNGSIYVKQSYLRVYRDGWKIKEEKSRCFLKNGQVLIFKENGTVEVLYASGTKCNLYEFAKTSVFAELFQGSETSHLKVNTPCPLLPIPRYDITTATGEVLEKSSKYPGRNNRRISHIHKVYIGVDSDAEEIFYKREDGACCMLWSNGKLVTNFPDGTKITSIPDFDETEIASDWTEEEQMYFLEVEAKIREKILREKQSQSSLNELSNILKDEKERWFENDSFVCISCSYLMEHPKYSSVYFDPNDPFIDVKMPKNLSIKMHPEGNYIVNCEKSILAVDGSTVEFRTKCSNCEEESTAFLSLQPDDFLCKFVDLYRKTFYVYKNGETMFQEANGDHDGKDTSKEFMDKDEKKTNTKKCEHLKHATTSQRCFAFERDLSGIEFFSLGALARYIHQLPKETHFDLHLKCEDESIVSHTFSRPCYEVGFENWTMEYENKKDSLPTNLKKKDLKEQGVKEKCKNLFKYPFPKTERVTAQCQCPRTTTLEPKMPKVIETRMVNCLSQEPLGVLDQIKKYISLYQNEAREIHKDYKAHKAVDDECQNENSVQMRLKKIALTLNQNLNAFFHLCTQVSSTEKDIHYFGHFINMMDTFKSHVKDDSNLLPNCKQIPQPLPRSNNFNRIDEHKRSKNTL